MNPSDETLMTAVTNGRLEKLSELFRRYRDPLYTFLLRRTNGDQGIAEDLLQDTFERILKYRSSYRNNQPFKAWAYTIARNVLNDQLKRAGRMPLKDGFDFGTLPLDNRSANSCWEEHEDQGRMLAALNGLSSNYREVVDLAWKRELKYAEIARILNTSESNVKVRMHRACKQLQANYQKLS